MNSGDRAGASEITCPLCAGRAAREVERVSFERIWRGLESEWHAKFSQSIVERHTPASHTCLRECLECGLQYFSPSVPGDAGFYRQLMSETACRYSTEKWDFDAAGAWIAAGDRVLDMACGRGEFLSMMSVRGARVIGIDTNPEAIAAASRRGLEAYAMDMDEYAARDAGRFDVVTMLQVIEHVAAVPGLVRRALDCLKPSGILIIIVPDRLRRTRAAFEPLDCPPHHISRWTGAQFEVLAELTRSRVVALRHELGSVNECCAWLRRDAFGGGHDSDPWPIKAIARAVFLPPLYRIYAWSGLLNRLQYWRFSVLAVLRNL